MQRFVLLAAGGMLFLVFDSGCTRPAMRPDGPVAVTTAPASRPVVVPTDVPIVYGPRYDGLSGGVPLSDQQIKTLLDRASECCPQGQRIWFIYALANWDMGDRREASVEIFFTPESQTARLRKGRFMRTVDRLPGLVAARLREFWPSATAPAEPEPLPEYWQVSRADHPFTGEPGVPRGSLIPFPRPEGFTEEEVIEIVDFVRTGPHDPDDSPTGWSSPQRLDTALPIYRIRRDGDDVEVWTGALEDMLAGAGEILRCRKKEDGGFEVISISMWVS